MNTHFIMFLCSLWYFHVYPFENSIVNDKFSNNEVFRVTKALLHMAEKSQSPTRIKYIDPLGMSKFAKTYLQRKE